MTVARRLGSEAAALGWAVRTARSLRREVHTKQLHAIKVEPPPEVSQDDARLARLFVRHAVRNCLVQSLLRQAWFAGQGRPRALVIGVRAPGADFCAHAWLDGDSPASYEGFEELARFPAR